MCRPDFFCFAFTSRIKKKKTLFPLHYIYSSTIIRSPRLDFFSFGLPAWSDVSLRRDVPVQRRMWMQAAHEYYLQHATSEVGHRSPICSPCLRLLRAARSADRSAAPQPDGAQSDHRDYIFILFYLGYLFFSTLIISRTLLFFFFFKGARGRKRRMLVPNGTRKVILNVCCNSRHSWEMIGSDQIGGVYVARPPRLLAPCDRVNRAPKLAADRCFFSDVFFFFF